MPPQMGMPYPNLLEIPAQANQQAHANWMGQQEPDPEEKEHRGMPSAMQQMLQQKWQDTGIPDAAQNARFQAHNAIQSTGIPGQLWGMRQDLQRGADATGIPGALGNAQSQLQSAWQGSGIPGQMRGIGQDLRGGMLQGLQQMPGSSLFFGM